MHCENTRHKQHFKRFLKKYPTADKKGEFAIITVNPEDWAIDLEDPKVNLLVLKGRSLKIASLDIRAAIGNFQ